MKINKLVAQSQAIVADRDVLAKLEKHDNGFAADLVKAFDGQYSGKAK